MGNEARFCRRSAECAQGSRRAVAELDSVRRVMHQCLSRIVVSKTLLRSEALTIIQAPAY